MESQGLSTQVTGSTTTFVPTNRIVTAYQVFDTELDSILIAGNLITFAGSVMALSFSAAVALYLEDKLLLCVVASIIGTIALGLEIYQYVMGHSLIKKDTKEFKTPRQFHRAFHLTGLT